MAKVVIHQEVDDEFSNAYLWYASHSKRAAANFVLAVRAALDRIATRPHGGTVYDAGHRYYRVRRYPHLVIYRYSATEDTATVVAISHPSQDQAFWQTR